MKKILSVILVAIICCLSVCACASSEEREKAKKFTEYLKGKTYSGEIINKITLDTAYSSSKSEQTKIFVTFYEDGSACLSYYCCFFETKSKVIDDDIHHFYDTEKYEVIAKGDNEYVVKLSTGEYRLSIDDEDDRVLMIKYDNISLSKSSYVDVKAEK